MSASQNAEFHHQHALFKITLFTKPQCYKPSYWNALTHFFTSLKQLVGLVFFPDKHGYFWNVQKFKCGPVKKKKKGRNCTARFTSKLMLGLILFRFREPLSKRIQKNVLMKERE